MLHLRATGRLQASSSLMRLLLLGQATIVAPDWSLALPLSRCPEDSGHLMIVLTIKLLARPHGGLAYAFSFDKEKVGCWMVASLPVVGRKVRKLMEVDPYVVRRSSSIEHTPVAVCCALVVTECAT